jgi:NTE family protein
MARVENARLLQYERGAGYGASLVRTQGGQDLRVVLAFSGGGTRAAALAYGVLKELRDTEVVVEGKKQRLLDTVTTISSVSGGSFTSAYYGLYGDRIFEDFEERFLRRNIEGRLIGNMLRPFEFLKLSFTPYTRSDLAMNIYDKEVFDGATFGDLQKAGGPLLFVNATDIDIGSVFTFIQPSFNMICSDLSKLRVSQAVTASSAVPGLFEPLRLRNFAGSCEHPEPEWIREALANPTDSRRRHHDAVHAATYLDAEKRPNIYLVDGGVSDNIGARRILANVIVTGGFWEMVEQEKISVPSAVLYIVVNAQAGGDHGWVQKAGAPSLARILGAVTSVGMYRYNFETIELLRENTADWSREATKHGHRLDTYVSDVAFDNLSSAEEREFFNRVATSFDLDDETIDRLIEVGGRLLRDSPDFQEFLSGRQ